MKRCALLVLCTALLVVAGDPPKTKDKTLSGVIVSGKVLQIGAEFAPGWAWTLDADAIVVKDPLVTDAKGKFEKTLPWKGERTYLAMDKARKLGFGLEIKEGDLAKPLTLRLVPLVRVKVKVKSQEAGFTTEGVKVGVKLNGAGRIGSATTTADGLAVLIPPGGYKLEFWKDGWVAKDVEITVPQGAPEFTVPAEVELMPGLLSRKMGQVLPEWHIADAIGIAKDTKMASFRGKWLLMHFWRHGCPSCRGWGIPNLVKFHDNHLAWQDKLQIVGFHNRDAGSAKELSDLLSKNSDMTWGVLALPFPMVIDAQSPSTVEEWGTGQFPYAVLVDPDGKLAAKGTLEEIETFLQERLK